MTKAPDTERTRTILAFVLVGAFVGAIPLFVYKTIPEGNNDIIVYMVGQLSGMALMALGLYFTKNAGQDAIDETRAANTGKALDAITAAANSTPPPDAAGQAAEQVAEAAADKADEIKDGRP